MLPVPCPAVSWEIWLWLSPAPIRPWIVCTLSGLSEGLATGRRTSDQLVFCAVKNSFSAWVSVIAKVIELLLPPVPPSPLVLPLLGARRTSRFLRTMRLTARLTKSFHGVPDVGEHVDVVAVRHDPCEQLVVVAGDRDRPQVARDVGERSLLRGRVELPDRDLLARQDRLGRREIGDLGGVGDGSVDDVPAEDRLFLQIAAAARGGTSGTCRNVAGRDVDGDEIGALLDAVSVAHDVGDDEQRAERCEPAGDERVSYAVPGENLQHDPLIRETDCPDAEIS